MINWKFELDRQKEYYETFKKQLERDVWHELKHYVLPTMPEKFRGRVIFLPKVCEPQKIYIKQKFRLNEQPRGRADGVSVEHGLMIAI